MTQNTLPEIPHLKTHDQPQHGHDTDGPSIGNPDCVAALISQQVKDGYKAVTLLHGGQDPDWDDVLSGYYSNPKDIAWLMTWGPIYSLGVDRKGLNWNKATNDIDYTHADEYLISVSRHRKDVARETLHFTTIEELAAHARQRNIHHAYVWQPDVDNPKDQGWWHYLRTMPDPPIQIPGHHSMSEPKRATASQKALPSLSRRKEPIPATVPITL